MQVRALSSYPKAADTARPVRHGWPVVPLGAALLVKLILLAILPALTIVMALPPPSEAECKYAPGDFSMDFSTDFKIPSTTCKVAGAPIAFH